MKFLKPYFQHNDNRGGITGISNNLIWKEVNYIHSVKDSIRGGHFHKKTVEMFFIINGKINVEIKNKNNEKCQSYIVEQGSCFLIEPYEIHTFTCLTDSIWINFLSEAMDSNHPDIFRDPSHQ